MNQKQQNILRWTARVLATAILLLGLPFYFGYGNPLPFASPANTAFDNVWMTIFPFVFIGLGIGWKWEKVAGYMVVVPIVLGSVFGLFIGEGLPGPMSVPLITGILYLVSGYMSK